MSWVVERIVQRELQRGKYMGREWNQFCEDYQIPVDVIELPESLPAMLFGHTILVRSQLSRLERAWHIWHEIGHLWAHTGNREFWRTRPQGNLILRKQEAQADYFAYWFPRWSLKDRRRINRLALYTVEGCHAYPQTW